MSVDIAENHDLKKQLEERPISFQEGPSDMTRCACNKYYPNYFLKKTPKYLPEQLYNKKINAHICQCLLNINYDLTYQELKMLLFIMGAD